jgi:hypothetical protein
MKVRILRSMAGLTFSFMGGEVVEYPESIARDWVDAGFAVIIDDRGETIDDKQPLENAAPKKRGKK